MADRTVDGRGNKSALTPALSPQGEGESSTGSQKYEAASGRMVLGRPPHLKTIDACKVQGGPPQYRTLRALPGRYNKGRYHNGLSSLPILRGRSET